MAFLLLHNYTDFIFKMIDKLDLLIIALIWGMIFIIDFQYSEYVILIVSFIGLIYAFYVTSILKKQNTTVHNY
ncbi:hypothetical protein [Staphylococcus haemolyticus]|uniref:hypothetical protein n=1 Tax=Staphylococcus haemolyticus TaxID=1283 RepID=UPI003905A5DF